MAKLPFEMPVLLDLNGSLFTGDFSGSTTKGDACVPGCENGCSGGCDKGSGSGVPPNS